MDIQEKKKLYECYKDDKEMLRLMLEIDNRKEQSKTHLYTHVILPCVMATAAVFVAFAAIVNLLVK